MNKVVPADNQGRRIIYWEKIEIRTFKKKKKSGEEVYKGKKLPN